MIQLLNCNTSLGSCCSDAGLKSIFGIVSGIITLIQIIAPILLMIMIIVDLTKLIKDPDDKKIPKSIKNKLNAAVILFFIPVIVNAFLSMTTSNSDVISCIKESKNVKLSANTKYIPVEDSTTPKQTVLPSSTTEYEKGKPKPKESSGTGTGTSNVTPGEKISSGEAVVGDNGVKLTKNIYHKKAAVTHKGDGQAVVEYAKSWKGKLSYKHGTTAELRPGGTCDCSQFVYQVLKHFDIVESEAPSIYCSMWGSGNVKGSTLYSSVKYLVPGDVVYDYFSTYAQHVEIYTGGNNTIGCNGGQGVVEGHRANKYRTFIHLSAYD